MGLETATYISDLVTSNPAGSDGLNNADDHLRLVKGTLKNTFPSITGAVTASHTTLNTAAGYVATGAPKLADAGSFFVTNGAGGPTGLGPASSATQCVLYANGVAAATIGAAAATLPGTLTVTGAITGPGVIPIGGMIMWMSDTLPTVGTWCWANGGTLSRTTYSSLFALWGNYYGNGDGSTTFNVPNLQEMVPIGKSTMGGATSPGVLASISAGLKAVIGSFFGSDTNTLTIAQLPAHTHANSLTDPGHAHTWGPASGQGNVGGTGASGTTPQYGTTSTNTGSATTGITLTNASVGSGTAVNNVMPARVVNFIIRIA